MPDQFIEVKRTGYGQNILKSILAIPVGILLFVVSFIILWSNEGRVNLSRVAAAARPITPATAAASDEGQLVAVSGPLSAATPLGDAYIAAGPYIALYRKVEMYAWIEERETKTEKQVGGSSVEKTTYRYVKKWTARPPASDEFKYPSEHTNPALPLPGDTVYALGAMVGAYGFDAGSVTLPDARSIALDQGNAMVPRGWVLAGPEHMFRGAGSLESPAVECGRAVTLFGMKTQGRIAPYFHKARTRLYRILDGTREEAIARLRTEHVVTGWLLRLAGFLLMWIGLTMFLSPISTVLDVLPFLGRIGRGLIGVITFVVALVLSLLTILISMIFHNLIALVVAVVVVIVVVLIFGGRKKSTAAAS